MSIFEISRRILSEGATDGLVKELFLHLATTPSFVVEKWSIDDFEVSAESLAERILEVA